MATFTERHGFEEPATEIHVRNDAPRELREAIAPLAYKTGCGPSPLRTIVCGVLLTAEDTNNWSEYPNVDDEVRGLINSCEWYYIYEITEETYRWLSKKSERDSHREYDPAQFKDRLNRFLVRKGIGWQLSEEGEVCVRGPEMFEVTLKSASDALNQFGATTAAAELHHALKDLSGRPTPELTGAIQHALAALECVARQFAKDEKATLGAILKNTPGLVPAPLDKALEKLWGYASEKGRHLQEGQLPTYAEAELVVTVAGAVCQYLAKKPSE